MKIKSKILRRKFSLRIELPPPHDKWAHDVVDSIERDELMVIDPADEGAFRLSEGEILGERAKIPISISEWLCVGCQVIRLHEESDSGMEGNVLGHSANNLPAVLWGSSMAMPAGPAAYFGEIVIRNPSSVKEDQSKFFTSPDAFRFLIAHELVHVFDAMRVLVPACMDWEAFWMNASHEGFMREEILEQYTWNAMSLDQYGDAGELNAVQQFWPSHAEKWFLAMRGHLPKTKA